MSALENERAGLLIALRFWVNREYSALAGYQRRARIGRAWEDIERESSIARIQRQLSELAG